MIRETNTKVPSPLRRSRFGFVLASLAVLISCSDGSIVLSRSQKQQVSAADKVSTSSDVATLAAKGSTPFQCTASSASETKKLRRLSKYELTNVVEDLLSTEITDAQGKKVVSPVADLKIIRQAISDYPVDVLGLHETFETKALSTGIDHAVAQHNVSVKVADLLTSNAAAFEKLTGKPCPSTLTDKSTCATAILEKFAPKVLRRNLSTPEIQAYQEFFRGVTAKTNAKEGLSGLVIALLNSPSFTYHLEENAELDSSGNAVKLTSFETANRISFGLTGSMPDDALRAEAASGGLVDKVRFEAAVDRILASEKTKKHVNRFFEKWLTLPQTANLSSLNATFLDGINSENLPQKMYGEMSQFINHVIWATKGSYSDLLLSRDAFVRDADVARVYGIAAQEGTSTGPTQLNAKTHAGLLTRSTFLLGVTTGTSPIGRGVKVRRTVLCDKLGDPPNTEEASKTLAPLENPETASQRRIDEHRTSLSTCMACHQFINGLGFAFEGHDALGRFRTEEIKFGPGDTVLARVPVQTDTIPKVDVNDLTPSADAVELSKRIAESPKASACFVTNWMEYAAVTTAEKPKESCERADIHSALTREGGSVLEMLKASVMTHHKLTKGI